MSKLGVYVAHLLRYRAKSVVLRSDAPVLVRFEAGDKQSAKSISHAALMRMIHEVVPAEIADDIAAGRESVFRVDYEGQLVAVQVVPGPQVWEVSLVRDEPLPEHLAPPTVAPAPRESEPPPSVVPTRTSQMPAVAPAAASEEPASPATRPDTPASGLSDVPPPFSATEGAAEDPLPAVAAPVDPSHVPTTEVIESLGDEEAQAEGDALAAAEDAEDDAPAAHAEEDVPIIGDVEEVAEEIAAEAVEAEDDGERTGSLAHSAGGFEDRDTQVPVAMRPAMPPVSTSTDEEEEEPVTGRAPSMPAAPAVPPPPVGPLRRPSSSGLALDVDPVLARQRVRPPPQQLLEDDEGLDAALDEAFGIARVESAVPPSVAPAVAATGDRPPSIVPAVASRPPAVGPALDDVPASDDPETVEAPIRQSSRPPSNSTRPPAPVEPIEPPASPLQPLEIESLAASTKYEPPGGPPTDAIVLDAVAAAPPGPGPAPQRSPSGMLHVPRSILPPPMSASEVSPDPSRGAMPPEARRASSPRLVLPVPDSNPPRRPSILPPVGAHEPTGFAHPLLEDAATEAPAEGIAGSRPPVQSESIIPPRASLRAPRISGAPEPGARSEQDAWLIGLDRVLFRAVRIGASQVIVSSGRPVCMRVGQGLRTLPDEPPPGYEDLTVWLGSVMPERIRSEFAAGRDVSFVYDARGVGRFRVRAFLESHGLAIAFFPVPERMPDPHALGLPAALLERTQARHGLVLVAGSDGSGRHTTLAALTAAATAGREVYAIVLEDAATHVFSSDTSLIHHRELGHEPGAMAFGIRTARRMGADVVVIGDLPDAASIKALQELLDAGRLVLAALAAPSAALALERIVGAFPDVTQTTVRARLADHLLVATSQVLLPASDGTLVAAREVLPGDPTVVARLRDGRSLREMSEQLLLDAVNDLAGRGVVAPEAALALGPATGAGGFGPAR